MEEDKRFYCEKCDRCYSHRQSFWKHRKRIHSESRDTEKLIEENEKLKHEIEMLKSKSVAAAAAQNTNSGSIHGDNNAMNNINGNNNIIISFGKEDISRLSNEEVKQVLKSGFLSIQNLVKALHLNPRIPENNNIRITNLRSKDCKIHDGEKFVSKSKNEVIKQLIENRNTDLESLYHTAASSEPPVQRTKREHTSMKQLIETIDEYLEKKDDKNFKEIIKPIIDDLIYMIYDYTSSNK